MLTLLGYGLLAVLVAVGLFLLAAWLLPAGEQIAPAIRDEPLWQLPPDEQLDADALEQVKLPIALRGYRFAETDLLLDRLGEELRHREAEIAELREQLDRRRSSPSEPAADGEIDEGSENRRAPQSAEDPATAS